MKARSPARFESHGQSAAMPGLTGDTSCVRMVRRARRQTRYATVSTSRAPPTAGGTGDSERRKHKLSSGLGFEC